MQYLKNVMSEQDQLSLYFVWRMEQCLSDFALGMELERKKLTRTVWILVQRIFPSMLVGEYNRVIAAFYSKSLASEP